MNAKNFFDAVEQNTLKNIYLFCGEEEYAKDRALEALVNNTDENLRDFNVSLLDSATTDSVIAACEALPVMADRRIVILRDARFWGNTDAEPAALAAYLPNICPSACLIAFARGDCDARKTLYKAISRHGDIVHFELYSETEAAQWAVSFAARQGAALPPGMAAQLVRMTTRKLSDVASEVTKLCDYAGKGGQITSEMLQKIVTRNLEYTVFEMLEHFIAGRMGDGLALLHATLEKEGGGAIIPTVMFFASRLRNMLTARQALDAGKSTKQAGAAVGGNPYAAQKSVSAAQHFTQIRLEIALTSLADLDYAIKSGGQKGESALSALLVQIFSRT